MTKALNILFGFFIVVIAILVYYVISNNIRINDLEKEKSSEFKKSNLNDDFLFKVNKNIIDYLKEVEKSKSNDTSLEDVKNELLLKIQENTNTSNNLNDKIDFNLSKINANRVELGNTQKKNTKLVLTHKNTIALINNYNNDQILALENILITIAENYEGHEPLLSEVIEKLYNTIHEYIIEYKYEEIFKFQNKILSTNNLDIQNKYDLIKYSLTTNDYNVLEIYFKCLTDYIIQHEIEIFNLIDESLLNNKEFLNKDISVYIDDPDSIIYKIMGYIRDHSGLDMIKYRDFENRMKEKNFFYVYFPKYLMIQRYNTLYDEKYMKVIESELFLMNNLETVTEIENFYKWLLKFSIKNSFENDAFNRFLTYDMNYYTDRKALLEDKLNLFNKNKKICSECPSKEVYDSKDYILNDFTFS